MKPIRPYGAVAALSVIFFALVPSMCAQEATPPRHIGVPQDWSQRHIVFSRDALAQHPDLIYREPRILHQAMQHWQTPNFGVFQAADPLPAAVNKKSLHRDWDEALAGHINAYTFPAKYSFYPDAAPDCMNDWVVFGLLNPETAGASGTGVHPNLVAFNNLYSTQPAGGLCGTNGPTVLFAYNITTVTGGRIATSPALSEDGTQIAFVETVPAGSSDTITATSIASDVLTVTASNSNLTVGEEVHIGGTAESFLNGRNVVVTSLIGAGPTYTGFTANFIAADYTKASDTGTVFPDGQSIFHVLTWTAGQGTLAAAAAPTMTSVLLSSTAEDITAWPWIDYGADTAYTCTDDGVVYQITGAFTATPTLSGSPWPITLSAGYKLSSPVLDSHLGLLMVGSYNGNLYQITTATGAVAPPVVVGNNVSTPPLNTSPGIVAPPIIDITNGTTFVVTANSILVGTAAIEEVNTSSLVGLAVNSIGLGSTTGTKLSLHEPAFSNEYYTAPTNSSSVISLCGTGLTDTTPNQYAFGFTLAGTKPIMNGMPNTGFPKQLSTSATDTCTGWTEFYNPNASVAGADFFFFGLTGDCKTILGGTSTTGCVVALSSDPTIRTATAAVNGGPSGIVVDNDGSSIYPQASSIYFTAVNAQIAYKFTQNGLE